MKKPILLLVLATLLLACGETNNKKAAEAEAETNVTTYYLIRHAEKDRSDKTDRNPYLMEAGEARAQRWAEYFKEIDLDAVYSTKYNRTIQTATPTAEWHDLEVQFYDAGSLYNRTFQFATKGKNVLVVGHSNTTPTFVNTILGEEKFPWMHDKDNSSLFIVTLNDTVPSVEVQTVE
ncbi:MAG: phosphoglycerate mutase family protein [Bacteroidota bacterium]